jgi:glycosyltransferase involved in cell wall biosynthesis
MVQPNWFRVPNLRILIATGVPRQREAGAAAVVLNHQRELVKFGHEVDCWYLDDVLANRKSGRFEGLSFASAIAKRILRERKSYDVVNLHAPYGCIYGIWKKLLRPAGAPPYVMTMQGSEERYVFVMRREDKKGRAFHFNWKNRLWHRLYHQVMFDYSIRTADGGAVANREAWSCAELKFGRDPGCIRYVPNGVEEKFFVERQYFPQPATRLLYVGTWLDRKGVYYLADAFQSIARNVPGVSLTLAGCLGPVEQVKGFFAPEVREQIRVIPSVSREEMPGLYASHDILVFPSLMEGMPLTVLEAMATGLPVVTTETPGMVELVEDGFNGLLVQPADAAELAFAVERLCNSSELRMQLGQAAQNTMRGYTWEIVTRKLEHILLIASGKSRGSNQESVRDRITS